MNDELKNTTPVGPPEPELRAALVAHFGANPDEVVDWNAQADRIVAAARLPLARRARDTRVGWQRPAARWARFAIPAGLAAGVLLAVAAAAGPTAPDTAADDPGMREVAAVAATDAVAGDPLIVTDQELALSILLNEEP
jgi:hypothetical protein